MAGLQKTCRVCGGAYRGGELFCPADGTRLSTASDLRSPVSGDPHIGETLDGRYRILRIIGEGGMGIVYEAEHVSIHKHVAVKILREDFTRRADVVERFRREARSASRIGHPNIVEVLDFGQTRTGASYFAMEMLRGEDLADLLSRETALSPVRALQVAYQCCLALSAAHGQGIVHRDLKPENVFLVRQADGRDQVKIVDFGVAKMSDLDSDNNASARRLTRTGMIFGTPEYMSPEQARGKELDERVDVYALGVLMYELVTGRVPFEGDNFMELLNKHANAPVPPLTAANPSTRVSDEFARIIYRALHKDRDHRYPTMDALAKDLLLVPEMADRAGLAAERPWLFSPPSLPPVRSGLKLPAAPPPARRLPTGDWARNRRSRTGLVLVAAAALVALVPLWFARPQDPAVPEALLIPEITVSARAATAPSDVTAVPGPDRNSVTEVAISSRPAGATVSMDGGGELCAATPCTVTLSRDVPVRLLVRQGEAQAIARIAPTTAHQKVHLVLRKPTTEAPAEETHIVSSDLKVPAAFR